MFGLRNHRGSCWINAALQGIYRIPDLQTRFANNDEDDQNPVEVCLAEVWASKGDEGLKSFYECVKTSPHMPAGEGIGDSHELVEFLCDKIPFLDKLMRFRVVNSIQCKSCRKVESKPDTMHEFSIAPSHKKQSVSDSIADAVKPLEIPDWKCDACSQRGCTKQLLLAEFPQILTFHMVSVGTSVSYTPILVLNKMKYALFAVVCFTGGHWYTWGRDLPPGKPWHRLDDTHVQSYSPTHMPLDDSMRFLMYYRLNE